MPRYRIDIATSDGSLDSTDAEGIELDHVGRACGLLFETMLDATREKPPAGKTRTITVTARAEDGRTICRDSVTVRGAVPEDDAAVGRAIRAMR